MNKKATIKIRNVGYLIGLTAFLLVMVNSTSLLAQRTVNVSQGFGTLNTAIDSDTTATGARVDSTTVYVLESGGIYLLDGSIEHRDFHLTIVAEEGYTERPRLIPAVGDGGGSDRPFRPRGDLTVRGLYITGEDEQQGLNTRIIRVSANDVTIRVDDCHLDKDGQTAFRLDGTGVSLYITNSIVSNIGPTSSPNNGRVIDDRGNDMGTVYIENSTFYNLTSQVLRDDGGIILRAHVNQNTFYNIGINTTIELGAVVDAKVMNNIFYNTNFYGYDTNEDGDPSSQIAMLELSAEQIAEHGAQTATFSHNNFYMDSAIIAAYPDNIAAPVNFDSVSATYVTAADSATFLNEMLSFTDVPATPADIVSSWWTNPDGEQPDFDTAGQPFDFAYASAASSTASTTNEQLGARTWFGVITSTNEVLSDLPDSFELYSNYPNPFNPTTNLSFSLPQTADVSVEIYNVLGQNVMNIPARRFTSGANQIINVDASSLTTGMYIYRVVVQSASNRMVQTGKMTLMK